MRAITQGEGPRSPTPASQSIHIMGSDPQQLGFLFIHTKRMHLLEIVFFFFYIQKEKGNFSSSVLEIRVQVSKKWKFFVIA